MMTCDFRTIWRYILDDGWFGIYTADSFIFIYVWMVKSRWLWQEGKNIMIINLPEIWDINLYYSPGV